MNPLVISSTALLLPTLYSAWCLNWPYALLTFNLYLSSQIYHRRHCRPSFYYDQVAIASHWFYNAYINWSLSATESAHFWLITLYVLTVHYYGYITHTLSFDPIHHEWWHATMHYIIAAGMLITQFNSA